MKRIKLLFCLLVLSVKANAQLRLPQASLLAERNITSINVFKTTRILNDENKTIKWETLPYQNYYLNASGLPDSIISFSGDQINEIVRLKYDDKGRCILYSVFDLYAATSKRTKIEYRKDRILFEQRINNQIYKQVIMERDTSIVFYKTFSGPGDSLVYRYDPATESELTIQYRNGVKISALTRNWIINSGKPDSLVQRFAVYKKGKVGSKPYHYALKLDSLGAPVIPKGKLLPGLSDNTSFELRRNKFKLETLRLDLIFCLPEMRYRSEINRSGSFSENSYQSYYTIEYHSQ